MYLRRRLAEFSMVEVLLLKSHENIDLVIVISATFDQCN